MTLLLHVSHPTQARFKFPPWEWTTVKCLWVAQGDVEALDSLGHDTSLQCSTTVSLETYPLYGGQTEWLINWLIAQVVDWLINCLNEWLTGWLYDWLKTSWLIVGLIDWLGDWVIDWLIDWWMDSLIDWGIEGLIDWLNGWLIDFLLHWLIVSNKVFLLTVCSISSWG